MKRFYQQVFFTVYFFAIFLGCKKNSTTSEPSLYGKWYMDSVQQVEWTSNGPEYYTIGRETGRKNYYDINPNGKLYFLINNFYDTAAYILITPANGDSYLQLNQSIYADTIKKLTEHNLILTTPQGGETLQFLSR